MYCPKIPEHNATSVLKRFGLYHHAKSVSFYKKILLWFIQLILEGFGINQLLDERIETYWQSDGPQPHTITIEFQKYTEISFLLMYLDYKSDESYTPQKWLIFQ